MNRRIFVYKNHFKDFYKSKDSATQRKIEYVLDPIRFEKNIPKKFFKYIDNTDGIYEIRVITTFMGIRILCFFDKGNIIVLTNCFLKKTQKTPKREIKLAESLKKEYMIDKYGGLNK